MGSTRRIDYKKLPRGWSYPISRKDAIRLMDSLVPRLCAIVFEGCSSKPNYLWLGLPPMYSLGNLRERATAGGWRYRLVVRGIPQTVIDAQAEDTRARLHDEIRNFVTDGTGRPWIPPVLPAHLGIWMEQRQDAWALDMSLSIDDRGMAEFEAKNDPWWERVD